MDKYHAFELGLAMGKGMLLNNQSDRETLATDEEAWITIKPHGKDADLCMSAEKLAVWNKYGCKLIEMIGNDDVNNRYLDNFSVLLKD